METKNTARVVKSFNDIHGEQELRNISAGMMTVEKLPEFFAGLKMWSISDDHISATYRHPTKKATLGRVKVLNVGDVVAIRDYGRRG